ncbi:site-specific DNA-methyltransferase [Alistipes communis]|jgi:adenine-specific DNA-methyltransferase|uniref:Site-specific DNA-methyltransferase n=2 Tax=Alistipes communis TaxID=2585118 RepID=A0A4Y1WS84_9BACT|nr:site-specific DNA-methyltransferase [Alistipes communis]
MVNINILPHFMKYMGSKREILEDINLAIKDLNIESEWFCDLFAGTSIVGCAFLDTYNICVNDIQSYSAIFAHLYASILQKNISLNFIDELQERVNATVAEFDYINPNLKFDYSSIRDYNQLIAIETAQQNLITKDFDLGFSFFVKNYSGTYWSYEQCKWIDSIRAVAECYKGSIKYYVIMSALIFAMSYASQSTGHFAQYRDVTKSNMNDILIYRGKNIWNLFCRKFEEICNIPNLNIDHQIRISSLDYVDCLRTIEPNSIIYADPPYSAVHYSRFYHAIETLVQYDHPVLQYKGRYRENRHQSPFDKKSEVESAFVKLFKGIKDRKSHLILSYSDTGLLSQNRILEIGHSILGRAYKDDIKTKEYIHSKMGRSDEYQHNVHELLISFKRI